jgi:exonuclease SbcC
MWYPKKISLYNFRSFVDQEYYFQKGAYLIQGINNTDSGAESNGSGKSSLREAICFALNLSTFSEINTDLINNNADSCIVTLILVNSITNDELLIDRTQPKKGSSTLIVRINGIDQRDKFATVPEGNKFIIDTLGISKEDLLNYYIISKEKFVSFFDSSDTKVKELIGRFSSFDRINGVDDTVQEDIDKLNSKLLVVNSEADRLDGKLESLQEQLANEKSKDKEQIKSAIIDGLNDKIKSYEVYIQSYNDKIIEHNDNIIKLNKDTEVENAILETLEEELSKLDVISFDKEINLLEQKKSSILGIKNGVDKSISELNKNYNEFLKFKREVENSIAGSISCPKCLHEFIPGDEIDIVEAKTNTLPQVIVEMDVIKKNIQEQDISLKNIEEQIKKVNVELNSYQSKITEFNNHKLSISKKIGQQKYKVEDVKQSLSKENYKKESYYQGMVNTKFLIIGCEKSIEDAKNQQIQTQEKEIQNKIDDIEKQIVDKAEQVQKVKDEIFNTSQWLFRFKKFRSYLANESLELIQGYTNMYLKKMKTNLSLQLEGYKTNKDGSIREKITPVILRDGEKEGSGNFRKFSGGERGKINFAVIIALQNLINNSSKNGGMSLLYTDEITESIDSTGLENIVESLNGLDKYCLVTSHVQHNRVHENILTIVKEKGISKIV